MNEEYSQAATMGGNPPFELGVGGSVGAEYHVDGTPLRLVVGIVVMVAILIALDAGKFRYHVVV
jgi:hypothetical protein